jgi:hypothetical protein
MAYDRDATCGFGFAGFGRLARRFEQPGSGKSLHSQLRTNATQASGVHVPEGGSSPKVNNSGDSSWHKTRIFISEVFRFEELAFELVTLDCYKVFFRDMEIGELNAEELRFRAARRVV